MHPGHIELKQPTVFNNLPRNLVFALSKLGQRNFLARANAFNQRKIRRGQHPQVLAILLVNALDVFGDHDFDPGAKLRIGRLLAARPLATPLAADCRHKAAALHVATLDRHFVATFQAGVWKFAQRFVEEKADVRRSDFVSGDILAQFGIVLRILGVPGKVFASQLPLDQFRIFGEK